MPVATRRRWEALLEDTDYTDVKVPPLAFMLLPGGRGCTSACASVCFFTALPLSLSSLSLSPLSLSLSLAVG